MKMIYLVIAMLLSVSAYAEVPVDVYAGAQQTSVEVYGAEGDIYGGVVGFWMDDRVAIEFAYEETSDFAQYEAELIGSIFHIYRQRITWQLGANYVEADVLGIEATDSFYHYGLGYELQPLKHLTLRAQYNVYGVDKDNGTENPHGVTVAVLYNF